jgi:hypothetical protein
MSSPAKNNRTPAAKAPPTFSPPVKHKQQQPSQQQQHVVRMIDFTEESLCAEGTVGRTKTL